MRKGLFLSVLPEGPLPPRLLSMCVSAPAFLKAFLMPSLKQHPSPSRWLITHFNLFIALIWNLFLSALTPVQCVLSVTPKLESYPCEGRDFIWCAHHTAPNARDTAAFSVCQRPKSILKALFDLIEILILFTLVWGLLTLVMGYKKDGERWWRVSVCHEEGSICLLLSKGTYMGAHIRERSICFEVYGLLQMIVAPLFCF